MIPYGRQDISDEDIKAVIDVLKSDFLTQGPAVSAFEKAICNYSNVNHAIAVNSGTSALHIACLAIGLGEEDWLWTSPNTFVASANCGLYCGANVDFVDIDPHTYNMCVKKLEEKLIQAESQNKLPKIIIPVHFAGQSCDMKSIYRLSKKYGFRIVEDASHAIGGKYLGEPIGNCKYSDITVFSFHPVKIITSGEGGIATTNSSELANKMELLRSHGVTRDSSMMNKEPEGDWYYQQLTLGFNYRMTDIQAALGTSQMNRLNEFVQKRSELAKRYDELLKDLPVKSPYQHPDCLSSFHLYPILLNLEMINKTRKQIFTELRENGIGVNIHYIPVHTQPYYAAMGFKCGDFEEAEKYYRQTISLPLHSRMNSKQQNYIVDQIEQIISH